MTSNGQQKTCGVHARVALIFGTVHDADGHAALIGERRAALMGEPTSSRANPI